MMIISRELVEKKGYRIEELQRGLEKGRLEELITIVGNILAKGMDIKIIAKCVNLPENKVIKIKTSMKKIILFYFNF